MPVSAIPFTAAASVEIDELHRLLQAWFRAEGEADPAAMLAHYDESFTMITPAGQLITNQQFVDSLPDLRGARPTLAMEISDVTVRHATETSAVVTYQERQIEDAGTTTRISTVLLVKREDRATPVWRHLQETWVA